MCGRFTQRYTWNELVALYRLTMAASNLEPRFNIAPTTDIDTVISRGDRIELTRMRWGLCPWWWEKSLKELPSTFNARAETVAGRPMFRDAFKNRRCLIPASGYYEWKTMPDGKHPYYISARDSSLLSFAGLWDEWAEPATVRSIRSATIIVTDANTLTAQIHNRMPVILAPAQFEAWLSGKSGPEVLKPAPNDTLRMWPVSRRVNKVDNDNDQKLIEPIAVLR